MIKIASASGNPNKYGVPGGQKSAKLMTRATYNKPDVAAADGVTTSLEEFTPFFGTSAAAPHAAAVAALLIEATGGPGVLKNTQIADLLRATAVDLGAPGPDNTFGFGALDVPLQE